MLYKYIFDGAECWLTQETGDHLTLLVEWLRDTDRPEDWEVAVD